MRIVRFTVAHRGFRSRQITLVTTLLDPAAFPAEELAALYGRRWRLELCFRDLKTTMGMEMLRCKSPEMARKEVLAYLVAHNLVRCVMAEAALVHQAQLDRLSFKGALDGLRQYSAVIPRGRNREVRQQLWEDLLFNLVQDAVPELLRSKAYFAGEVPRALAKIGLQHLEPLCDTSCFCVD